LQEHFVARFLVASLIWLIMMLPLSLLYMIRHQNSSFVKFSSEAPRLKVRASMQGKYFISYSRLSSPTESRSFQPAFMQ
jgi:hypothetical protein